jgi:hypothetical protein
MDRAWRRGRSVLPSGAGPLRRPRKITAPPACGAGSGRWDYVRVGALARNSRLMNSVISSIESSLEKPAACR